MFKRFLSLVLCLCLLGMASVAFADTDVQTPNPDNFAGKELDITAVATNTAEESTTTVYSVEIVWGDMQFAYGYSSAVSEMQWNPETHMYDIPVVKGTGAEANKGWYMLNEDTPVAVTNPKQTDDSFIPTTQDSIMVFNHSNATVDVEIKTSDVPDTASLTATVAANADCSANTTDITGGFSCTLSKGADGDIYKNDGSCVYGTVSINGVISVENADAYSSEVTIAKLTVTISKGQ